MRRIASLTFAAFFAFGSIQEWAHFRRAFARRDLVEMWGTCTAAIACGFIASEALEDEWP